MKLVISYDIKSDRRRTKLFNLLKNYGDPIQYSVFECDLTLKQLRQLRQRMGALVEVEETDTVCIYRLCAECRKKIERLGGRTARDNAAVIL
ncbi:MAG: CRISPR-associated endonuclease Cas2 [bacterium]|nr:CRISPR-associated endonuclease Cas2 [bacterium]